MCLKMAELDCQVTQGAISQVHRITSVFSIEDYGRRTTFTRSSIYSYLRCWAKVRNLKVSLRKVGERWGCHTYHELARLKEFGVLHVPKLLELVIGCLINRWQKGPPLKFVTSPLSQI